MYRLQPPHGSMYLMESMIILTNNLATILTSITIIVHISRSIGSLMYNSKGCTSVIEQLKYLEDGFCLLYWSYSPFSDGLQAP